MDIITMDITIMDMADVEILDLETASVAYGHYYSYSASNKFYFFLKEFIKFFYIMKTSHKLNIYLSSKYCKTSV